MQVEKSKVVDSIFIKYNMTLTDLLRAVKHYKLDAEEDIKALRATQRKAKAEKLESLNQLLELTPEQTALIQQGVQQAGKNLDPPTKEGNLTFTSFQKLYLIINQLVLKVVEMKGITFKTQRRAILAEGKNEEYKECIRQYSTKSSMTAAAVKMAVLKEFGVPVDLFDGQCAEIMADTKGKEIIQALDKKIKQVKLV